MRQPLTDGNWFDVKTEKEHENLKAYGKLTHNSWGMARVQIGKYAGPGRYLVLSYQQRCPRNCCYDSVSEVLSAEEVATEVREQLREFYSLLKQADPNSTDRETKLAQALQPFADLLEFPEEYDAEGGEFYVEVNDIVRAKDLLDQ